MVKEGLSNSERRIKTEDFRAIAKGFQRAFEGYSSIPAMFAPIPIREGKTPTGEVMTPNGSYTIERSEYVTLGRLEIVVKRSPAVKEADSLVSETVTLRDGKDERGSRKILVRYVRVDKISPEDQEAAAREAIRKGEEGIHQLTSMLTTSEVSLGGYEALPPIRDFIEGIRMANPNLQKK